MAGLVRGDCRDLVVIERRQGRIGDADGLARKISDRVGYRKTDFDNSIRVNFHPLGDLRDDRLKSRACRSDHAGDPQDHHPARGAGARL